MPNSGHPMRDKVLTQIKAKSVWAIPPGMILKRPSTLTGVKALSPLNGPALFSSADIGVNIRGNFGGQLANAKEITGNAGYDGRYGSWHLGVYNGCGYSSAETNYQNKVPEYRVTIRPLPDLLPGFQATYFGLYGQGNSNTRANLTVFPPPPLLISNTSRTGLSIWGI